MMKKFNQSSIMDLGKNNIEKVNITDLLTPDFSRLKILYLNYNKIDDLSSEFTQRLVSL